MKATVLAVVGLGITVAVYGTVALIVKAMTSASHLPVAIPLVDYRRGVVHAMPSLLAWLSLIGTLAMLWVGGGIILHGLAEFGLSGPEYSIKKIAAAAGSWLPWVVPSLTGSLAQRWRE